MKRTCRISLVIAVLFMVAGLWAASARAGGIGTYEMGTPDVGLASAGWAARAQDASTVFKNPAGMSLLKKSELQVGLQAIYGNVKFSPNDQTTATGNDGGNPVEWAPGGSLFYVHKFTPDLSAGVGAFSYFGGSLHYDNNWVGRYYAQQSILIGYTLMPAVSYRITRWLSLGAGLNVTYSTLKAQVAVHNFDAPDGQVTYKDDEWGYGGNFGVIVEPFKGTRIGIDYMTEMELKFSDVPQYSGIGPGLDAILRNRNAYNTSLQLNVYIPQMIMGSIYQELGSKWAVMANLGWQQWSKFGKPDITIVNNEANSTTANLNYDDTWHLAGGVEFRPLKAWTFTAGVGYDSSAVNDQNRSVALPMGETYRFGLGALWQLKPDIKLGFAYENAYTPDMNVDQNRGPRAGRLSGKYSDFDLNFFALNLTWDF
jgi:long-chain fatty acid transport protein